MKPVVLIILILLVPAVAAPILPEKEGIISNIEMICNSDSPDSAPLRDNADSMLKVLRTGIEKSRAFSAFEKAKYTAEIDSCIAGRQHSTNPKTSSQVSTSSATSRTPRTIYGQKVTSPCNVGLISTDFYWLRNNNCLIKPTP